MKVFILQASKTQPQSVRPTIFPHQNLFKVKYKIYNLSTKQR